MLQVRTVTFRSRVWILAVGLVCGGAGNAAIAQQEIGFIEKFALAPDRRAALNDLIPGTEEFYYFTCLHHQNIGELAEAQTVLEKWRGQLGETVRVQQMHTRQMLLTYSDNPQRTLDFLRDRLGLDFNHAPPSLDRAAELPSTLNNARLTTSAMLENALRADRSLNQIETSGLRWVLDRELAPDQLRSVLQRADRIDLPRLVERVAEELSLQDSAGFGSFAIHQQLTLAQLEQLLKLRPQLLERDIFVRAYAARLAPPEGSSLTDKAELRSYLQRLLVCARQLPPSQNSFKALVFGNLLKLDMSQGKFDRGLFVEYLGLPRNAHYYDLARFKTAAPPLAELGFVMSPQVPLPAIGDDTQLVLRYLENFLKAAANVDEFAMYLNRDYLERVLAETKILYGIGDSSIWYAKLSPAEQKAIKDRVELRFAAHNSHQFQSADEVSLLVELKNVSQLIVRIYKINSLNHYRSRSQPISTDIDLDGLVANVERKFEFAQGMQLRHLETIALPELSGRGVWVVDLLGGGQRSRAVIQKGGLVAIERLGDAGHVFTIVDETGATLKSAHLELNGRTYTANAAGKIILPYAEADVSRNVLLVDDGFAALQSFVHRSETYQLQTGFMLDRQSLVAGKQASVAIRTRLQCNGRPISIQLLEEPSLTIVATNLDGIATTQVVGKLDLDDGDDLVHKFLVPQRLARLSLTLTGRVFNQNRQERQEVTANHVIDVNGIQRTNQIADFYLQQSIDGFRLLVLGRNGEPIARVPVSISAKVESFAMPQAFSLATNAQGMIELGELSNVSSVTVSAQGLQVVQFPLHRFHRHWPNVVHAGIDSKIVLPLGKELSEASQFALVDIRRDVPHSLQTDNMTVSAGAVEISGLPPGDYWLHDYEAKQQMRIVVADAKESESLIAGRHRLLQADQSLVAIRKATVVEDKLIVEVSGADKTTRIHLLAHPLYPEASSGRQVELPYIPLMQQQRRPTQNLFVDSLRLDEEYSYILSRQGIAKYPGNMLAQPTLLVHPWEVSETQNASKDAMAGDPLPILNQPSSPAADAFGRGEGEAGGQRADWKSVDFLANSTILSGNFEVVDGQAVIPIGKLTGYTNLTVVVIHANASDSREVLLPKTELKIRDQRLKSSFAADVHLAQTQRVERLSANEKKLLGDPRTRRVQAYTSIADVYRLYETLLLNTEWKKFEFVASWHMLTDAERRGRYNEMACHELNFFLFRKDRKFFDTVVKPLIAQKLEMQLVDQWLLGESLEAYDQLWRVQRLNTLERILLAESIQSRKAGTIRWLNDFVAAHPLNPQTRASRFEAALSGMALSSTGYFSAALSDPALASDFSAGEASDKPRDLYFDKNSLANGSKQVDRLKRQAGASKKLGELSANDAKVELGVEIERLRVLGKTEAFTTLDQTREWAESQYYRVQLKDQASALVPPGIFWREYLEHVGQEVERGEKPFLPTTLDLPTSQINEALCALAVIDLPLDGTAAEVAIENEQLLLSTKQVAVVYMESIERAGEGGDKESLLVGQDIYLAQPDTSNENNRPLQGPLLRGIPYRANVVVTNPTNTKRLVQVLTQIPSGALPLSSGKITRNTSLDLEPYSTAQVQYAFYFPAEGKFDHYGTQVSSNGKHIVATESKAHQVLAKPDAVDKTTWSYIADWGTSEQVLDFLSKANLEQIDLQRIAFRMQDKKFFEQVSELLSANNHFVPALWAYAVRHDAPQQIQQLLHNRPDFVAQLGRVLSSPIITLDPREQFSYQHLDYKPLVVARAHRLGSKAVILNDRLFVQYEKLLDVIAHQRSVSNDQRLALCYYLLIQNRIEDALKWFAEVDADQLTTRLQYDYFDAYLNFYRGKYDEALQLAAKYADYPVLMWKDLFAQVVDQVKQRSALQAGQEVASAIPQEGNSNRQQRMLTDGREVGQTKAAAELPALDLANQDGALSIEYRNLENVKVNYYLMDIELLFSRNPFVARNGDAVPVIEPNLSAATALENADGSRRIELPAELQNRNLLVEVTAKGISRSSVVTANSLAVTVVEPFGRVQVLTAQGRSPLEQAYVKVYARNKDGSVKFYKDGYSDLRGQFDYASLSTADLDNVERFAILVLHETKGAVVREASPPTR